MSTPRDEHKRAEALELKERRARDAALAMRQYEEKQQAVLDKTARLRALRLEQEAANDQSKATQPTSEQAESTALIREIHVKMLQARTGQVKTAQANKKPAKTTPLKKTLKRA